MPQNAFFMFLCKEDRRHLYESILGASDHQVTYMSDVDQLLTECFKTPPMAIVVDLRSQVSIGSNAMRRIYELKTVWPVMRCTVHTNGSATVMCLEPNRAEGLPEALNSIAAGDQGWIAAGKFRQYLRLKLRLRTRLRTEGGSWERGNPIDISVRGAFVVNYEDHEKDEAVKVEIHDLCQSPLQLKGSIQWVRTWESATEALPGVGVTFDPGADTQRLVEELAKVGFIE